MLEENVISDLDTSCLTEAQRAVWEPWAALGLEHEDLKQRTALFRKVAADLGISVAAVTDRYTKCRKKLGLPDRPGNGAGLAKPRKRIEHRDPARAVRVIAAAADPIDNRTQHQIDPNPTGKTGGEYQATNNRIKQRLAPLTEHCGEILVDEMLPALGDKMRMLVDSIDDPTIQKAPLIQRSLAFCQIFDKVQILQGKPTSIIQTQEERQAAPEAARLLIEEMTRRGINIRIDPLDQTVDVTPRVGKGRDRAPVES